MHVYGYGEDALTLCTITRNIDDLLMAFNDKSHPSTCQVFYRPSFGRRGSATRSELGRFSFILLANHDLYLGESKWDKLAESIDDGVLQLQPEYALRHDMFRFYIDRWAYGNYRDWEEFRQKASPLAARQVPGKETRLASNLRTVLAVIREHYPTQPTVKDVVLYFHDGSAPNQRPLRASHGFELVCVDCCGAVTGNFVKIVI
jgi:hypothetical protein